jgi:hypothetical protein
MDVSDIPDQAALRSLLQAADAPPYLLLDIGGSAVEGDGVVRVRLAEDGNALVFEDA